MNWTKGRLNTSTKEKGTEDITVRQSKGIRSELQSCVEETHQSQDISLI